MSKIALRDIEDRGKSTFRKFSDSVFKKKRKVKFPDPGGIHDSWAMPAVLSGVESSLISLPESIMLCLVVRYHHRTP